ncbi:VPLPA-CTERM sorting domain-containing protein [Paracoccus caeni]|uniref:VPLPA-CTERM sorting domain-containing protein n=1 Tax=Paracoccus caeni TaxID=657651 RepID=A0A934SP73_9RHOB|nr:VPLPA-CTERM sorting domain-containing protein [Paracoccus caeni]MBK4217903.1 VPLPA-CTERM sorting domain-containing protein [Paracoccus caeni]
MKALAVILALFATPLSAATYGQGDTWSGQLSGGKYEFSFSAPYATPCGNGDWSGCSYQGGGSILAVDNPAECGGWCGKTLGTFDITAYKPFTTLTFDLSEWASKWIVIHFTGQNQVAFNAPIDQEITQPAPVPVPAALPLLLGGIGALAALRKRRQRAV